MPSPTARQSHIYVALTNVAVAYSNAAYIGGQIFPQVPVAKQTNKFFTFPKASWFRDEAAIRAPGARARRADYTLSTDSYLCLEKALAHQVTQEEMENSDDPLTPFVRATEYVTDQILKAQEIDVLDLVFGTGWSASVTPGTLWSNDAADPIGNIETAVFTIAQSIGRSPTTAVIGRGLWRYLKNHPDVVDRVKYAAGPSDPAIVSLQSIAALIGIGRLFLSEAVKDSGSEGAASSVNFIAGNHMWFGFVAPSAALTVPSAGYQFTWKQRETNRYVEDQEHADVVEVRASWDTKITAPDAGYLIKDAA